MTVKELIEKLEKFPEDAEVILVSNFGWESNADGVEEVVFKDGKVQLY